MSCIASLAVFLAISAPPSDEAFRSGVRPTEPLTAEEQRGTFHLPPGFEIQLFAAEPDIQKPMNLAFDGAGRLWMTGSVEYPYAAAEGKGRDVIKVLADSDGDGRADQITTFADGLNIPIGLYPYRDGVIAYSMPNIWFFRDTDGDGRADRREVLYGPLGVPRDTHGMQNAFRRGFDGWLYVNHGFANETMISARDGSSVKLQSGNTYRLRLDGSRVEQFTWGQVNPFGSTFLANGDMITADCHSKPLTMLLRGAYYSSFGKPHDGLGFAPDLLTHDHGSTAICGVVQLEGDAFPAEYRGRLLVGNVMTSRINQDALRYEGSSPRAIEQPDFLRSDDPWFRPVDLQVGPDGALYIADFYNRIIGHYEVPLDHPGRDKHRARIWRVAYRGDDVRPDSAPALQLATAKTAELIAALASTNPTTRSLASDQLSDRVGEPAVPALLESLATSSNATTRVHALWTLYRLGRLPAESLLAATKDSSDLVRIHAQRVLSETPHWTDDFLEAVKRGIADGNPFVRRAAADAAGQQSHALVRELLDALQQTPTTDPYLRHSLRIAVRDQLRHPEAWISLKGTVLPDELRAPLADIALGVPSEEAAAYLFAALPSAPLEGDRWEAQVTHLAVNLPLPQIQELITVVRQRLSHNMELQAKLLLILNQRLSQRGVQGLAALRVWGLEVARGLLSTADLPGGSWATRSGDNPWGLESRACADGQSTLFLSSLPGGERKVSVLRSPTFVIPPRLTFYLCGHLGFPTNPAIEQNYVQLRLAHSNEVVVKSLPPRNDTARRVEWELRSHAGRIGYLEVVDQLDLSAYAWLAIARIEPPVCELPATAPSSLDDRRVAGAVIAMSLQLPALRDPLTRLVADSGASWQVRQSAAQAVLSDGQRPLLAAACTILGDSGVDPALRTEMATRVVQSTTDLDEKALVRIMQFAPLRQQRQVADALAATAVGGDSLVKLVERGQAAARLLQDPVIRQKLNALGQDSLARRMDSLTATLPPVKAELQRLIEERRREFRSTNVNASRGQELFRKHCAGCHQVQGQGALVGPQLDGIGNRGVERVMEDVLDPNRNVDATFHVSVLNLANGRVVSGLVRREEGGNLILVDTQGKEFAVQRGDIDERSLTATSLMPANVNEILKADEFYDLIGFLLSLRAAK